MNFRVQPDPFFGYDEIVVTSMGAGIVRGRKGGGTGIGFVNIIIEFGDSAKAVLQLMPPSCQEAGKEIWSITVVIWRIRTLDHCRQIASNEWKVGEKIRIETRQRYMCKAIIRCNDSPLFGEPSKRLLPASMWLAVKTRQRKD